jgi:hypothetical protein
MRARWAMATPVALVAAGYATHGTTFSPDHTPAVESTAVPSRPPQTRREWRDRFEVNKADLLPTGTNRYITMQPGRVLELKHDNDTGISRRFAGSSRYRLLPGVHDQEDENGCSTGWRRV